MENTENKKVSAREQLLSSAREHYPDRTFADLDATEPVEGASDLDETIAEMLNDLTTKQAAYDQKNKALRDLLLTDPSAAEFIQKWVDTGDPRTALVEVFGDDLGINEESQGKFKAQLDGWRERKSANDALNAEADKNWEESLSACEKWGESKGLSTEEQGQVMLRLIAIATNGLVNKYTEDDFNLALNAIRHDSDVAAAREEGEVAGRNASISAARRERGISGAMPPAAAGGQAGGAAERKPGKPKSVWSGVK